MKKMFSSDVAEPKATNTKPETSVSSHYDALANMPLNAAYPSEEGIQQLKDELLFQHATQSYLWALPVLQSNYENVRSRNFSAKWNL